MESRWVAGTQPYPWPWDGTLQGARLALVLVGCQRWWPGRVHRAEHTLDTLRGSAARVREAGGLVVHVRHRRPSAPPRRAGALPRMGERGWEPLLLPARGDVVAEACGMDAFFGGALDAELRAADRDLLAIGGLGTESAVYSTVTAGNDRGYECLVLADAVAPHDPATAGRALASVTMSGGIFGATGTAAALCTALGALPRWRDFASDDGAPGRAERREHDLRFS